MALPAVAPPLLVTSSINVHAPLTRLADPDLRLACTLEALAQWRGLSPDLAIVICDGSGFDFAPILAGRFPGAPIECLRFDNDQARVARLGKGWGEGEIIRHALDHSSVLAEADGFAKCTAKLFVANFFELLRCSSPGFAADATFVGIDRIDTIRLTEVDTRFYVTTKALYRDLFLDAHFGTNCMAGRYIEHCFADIAAARGLEGFVFPMLPLIQGMSGTNAKPWPWPVPDDFIAADTIRRRALRLFTPYMAAEPDDSADLFDSN